MKCFIAVVAYFLLGLAGNNCIAQVYTLAYPSDIAPFSSLENGRAVGLDIDIVESVFHLLPSTLVLKPLPFTKTLTQVRSRKLQGVVALYNFQDSPFQDLVVYSEPLYYSKIAIYANSDSQPTAIKDLDELKNKRLGYLFGYGSSLTKSLPDIAIMLPMKSPEQLITRLKNKDLDYAIFEALLFDLAVLPLYSTSDFISVYQEHVPIAIALTIEPNNNNHEQLIKQINLAIAKLKHVGVIDMLIKKYGLADALVSSPDKR